MMLRSKFMRTRIKLGRLHIPGSGPTCVVLHAVNRIGSRGDDRRNYRQDLRYAVLEMEL